MSNPLGKCNTFTFTVHLWHLRFRIIDVVIKGALVLFLVWLFCSDSLSTSLVLLKYVLLFTCYSWWVFKCTCGMCPVEVWAPVDSRARLQCRSGPSCLPSGPRELQLCKRHTKNTLNTCANVILVRYNTRWHFHKYIWSYRFSDQTKSKEKYS